MGAILSAWMTSKTAIPALGVRRTSQKPSSELKGKRKSKQALAEFRETHPVKRVRSTKKGSPTRHADEIEYRKDNLIFTMREKRADLAKRGLVEHGLNCFDVLQRAVDDTATDYMMLQEVLNELGSPWEAAAEKPIMYQMMVDLRAEMTKYSALAIQHNLAARQAQLSEVKVALLGRVLKTALQELGVTEDQIKKIPAILEREVNAMKNDRSMLNGVNLS